MTRAKSLRVPLRESEYPSMARPVHTGPMPRPRRSAVVSLKPIFRQPSPGPFGLPGVSLPPMRLQNLPSGMAEAAD